MTLPSVYMLTCPRRQAMAEATLARWGRSDWGAEPTAVVDLEPEASGEEWGSPVRGMRIAEAYARMLQQAAGQGGGAEDWVLFLEDDLDFHPRIGSLTRSWPALQDARCVLASLFNPSLPAIAEWGEMERAFAVNPRRFLGAQALLLRRRAIERAVAAWDSKLGMQAQRLAAIFGAEGPIWVHRPSLVQHVAEDSSWGARVQQALDFDPDWAG